jgi:hypothetical protein
MRIVGTAMVVLIAASLAACHPESGPLSVASSGSHSASVLHSGSTGKGGSKGQTPGKGHDSGSSGNTGKAGSKGHTPGSGHNGKGHTWPTAGPSASPTPSSQTTGASSPPIISWSPTTSAETFNYGTVKAGQSASQEFTLVNSGGSATSALTASVSGAATFQITADSCTGISLRPSKSCIVTVSYTPTNESSYSGYTGTLTVNDDTNDYTNLALTGASTVPAINVKRIAGGPGPLYQGYAVSGINFLPNTKIIFTVTGQFVSSSGASGLNSSPYVYTDATGAFNSAPTMFSTSCGGGPATVTATDGTNTVTTTFDLGVC